MKLLDIYKTINEIAPFSLSEEYCKKFGAYDNSGIILDCGREITGALFSLDCSLRAVEEAKAANAELIVTHHPAIYSPLKELSADNPVTECAKGGISVLSAHLNLDCARGGIDEMLSEALGAKKAERMHTLETGGYGSVFNVTKRSLREFLKDAKETFRTDRVLIYGDKPVERIASFCGAGLDEESIAFAQKSGADTIVSSDPKHHLIAGAVENGINVVILTHYAAENYGFEKFYQIIKERCEGVRMRYFTDDRLL